MPRKILLICFFILLMSLACNFPARLADRGTTIPAAPTVQPAGHLLPTSTPFVPQPPTAILSPSPFPSPQPLATFPATQIPRPTYQPVFEPSACRFLAPLETSPDCGDLVVPEDRSHPSGRQVRLHVAIFRSQAAQPDPDPVVFLAGGPGSSALELAPYLFGQGFTRFLEKRDLIFLDQRGTEFSQPGLACPEVQKAKEELLSQPPDIDQSTQMIITAYQNCHDRLAAEGVDFASYNSSSSAADVDDLRQALGYTQVNLYGDSYGTRLALTMMRDHPEGLRSVILDSVYPLQEDLYVSLAADAERAFTVLFERCAEDINCNQAYPNLGDAFYTLVDRLNAHPVELILPSGGAGSGRQVVLNGGLLIDVLFTGMYNRDVIAWMPMMIQQVGFGDYSLLYSRLRLYFQPDTSGGMNISVQCHEELPFGSPEMVAQASAGVRPEIAAFFQASTLPLYSVCGFWGAGIPEASENMPVKSSIPSLVLAGEYDPITPPSWSHETASDLIGSYYYEYPGVGHWVLRSSGCALDMALTFLDNPKQPPDASCIAGMGGLDFKH